MGNNSSSKHLRPEAMSDLLESTKFTEQEIRQWYHEFSKDFPSGTVGIDQFKDIYIQHFPNGDATKFAEHVFRTFDKNDDRQLNFREFMTALSVTAHGGPKDRLRWAFQMYDIDESGYITKEECTEIVKAMYKMIGEDISPELLQHDPSERASHIFELLDADKNGQISEEEFVEGACLEPTIMSLLERANQLKY